MSAKPTGKKPAKAQEPETSVEVSDTEPVASPPDVPVPHTDVPEIPATQQETDDDPGASALDVPAPLTEREKHLVSIVTREVLGKIDPLLIKLQQISNEAVSMGAHQKLQELEKGINDRIESRINKINAIIGRRNQ